MTFSQKNISNGNYESKQNKLLRLTQVVSSSKAIKNPSFSYVGKKYLENEKNIVSLFTKDPNIICILTTLEIFILTTQYSLFNSFIITLQ